MNQKGFSNIALIVLVIVLAGTLGYVTLVKKPVPTAINKPPAAKNLKSCFNNEDALAANINKANWKTFEGFGFVVKYPTETIIIKSIVNPYNDGDFSFEISSLTSPHKATISVYQLRKNIYRARHVDTPSFLYEPYSDTWWADEYIWDPSEFVQCNPNPRGETDDGKYSIYSVSDSDADAFFVNYFVVLRNIIKTDNVVLRNVLTDGYKPRYKPLVVQFGTGDDYNDPNYSSYPAFKSILENIVKTLELRPTSKG